MYIARDPRIFSPVRLPIGSIIAVMPLDPITSSIIGSIINSAVQQISSLPAPTASTQSTGIPRVLPMNANKGELQMLGPMKALIDGKEMMLSPGVQARDPFNMMILPATISGKVPVRYTTDEMGAVNRIWVLSAQEADQPTQP